MLHVSRPPSPGRERRPRPGADDEANLIFFLPAEEETIKLVDTYFSNTGLLFPYIHRGTFIETYQRALATDIHKVRRSWLGLLNMILAMATNTSYDTVADAQDRSAKSERFFSRALGLCEKQMRSGSSLEIGISAASTPHRPVTLTLPNSPVPLTDESVPPGNREINANLEHPRSCRQGSLPAGPALQGRPEPLSAPGARDSCSYMVRVHHSG